MVHFQKMKRKKRKLNEKEKQTEGSYSFFLKKANPPIMPMSAVGRQQHESGLDPDAALPDELPAGEPPSKSAVLICSAAPASDLVLDL